MAEITIKTIFAQESRSLGRIGRVGENLAREIVFDCAKVLEGNADAQIVCAIKRQGDAQPYTRPLTADGEGRYTLTLTAADVAKAGSVQLELRMVDGDAVLKTAIYTGIVSESIGSVGDVPGGPVTDALNRLESATKEAGTAAGAALTAAEAAGNAAASTLAAEQERAAAEAERANSERERVIAETERAVAEEARAEAFAGYEAQIEAVTPDDTAIGARPWTSKKTVDALTMPLEESGSVVMCYPVEGYPLGIKTRIDAVQAGEGDPSPDNILPISGWDRVKLTRCGKNLLDPALCIASGVSNNVTLTRNADGSYTATGTPSGDISQYAFTVYIHTDISVYRQGVTYYCRTDTRSNHFKARIAYQNGVNDFKDKFTFDRENMTAIRLYLQVPIGEYVDGMTIHIGLYLEEDADWEPYCGDSCAAELPETVYGGTLDWETGVVTVTHGPIASYTGEELPGEWLSDRDVYAGGTVPTNGAQVVYKLAEPYTIQLTPRQILALAGKNNIYANSGEVEVRGRTDPVYLTNTLMERIAALEAAAINA